MDISNPTIIRVNNRYYRCLHPTNFKQRSKTPTNLKPVIADEYDDEEVVNYSEDFAITEPINIEEKLINEEVEEESNNDLIEDYDPINRFIKAKDVKIKLHNGQYLAEIFVPNAFKGYLIGKNSSNIKEICSKFKVNIDFPQYGSIDEPFLIIGQNNESVNDAYQKIYQLIRLKRNKSNLTHFLAINCYNDELKSNYDKFKNIVSKYLHQSFPMEVFIGRGKLHLTICTLALLNNYERNKMVSFMSKQLRNLIDNFLKDNNLNKKNGYRFKIKGLDYFGDDPSAVKILFGCVEDKEQIVQKLSNKINEAANEFGFTCGLRDKVKLHMTLMNTRYIPNNKIKQGFNSMDLTEALKDNELKNFYFGEVDLKEIHLSITGTEDEKTEAYKFTHKINVF